MKRSVAFVVALASLATLGTSQDAEANVRLTRRADGRVVIFNDIGSGWRVSGRAPSDSFLIARKSAPTPFDETIHACSRAHGIDPGLVKSVMLIESNFNPRAVSRKGARGLMQLMPATARRFGVTNAFDPHENIRGGTAYLAWLLGNFDGNVHLALAGYNAGEGAVARYGGVPPYAETQEYVRRGMLVYGGSGSSGALLEGGFMGQGIAPLVVPKSVEAAVRVPAVRVRSVPVRLSSGTNGGRMLSNAGSYDRPKPLLGRVQP